MTSANAKFWIWITQALGYNTNKVKVLSRLYPDISVFFLGGEREWRFCGLLNEKDIQRLKSTGLDIADSIIRKCKTLNYSVICIDDPEYPECLRNIYAPPAVLYVSGKLPDVDNRLTIGIVGTRTASSYGTENSFKIAYALSKYGVCTVSGGALGVDCASHRGALAADGVTICVRGCGINCGYLKENEGMRNAITRRGAVISEYPPDEKPKNYYFPARNRIIAALSDGVLIIESGEKSGSLITANLALEMGKEVFALLGNNSPQNKGSNQRIKEGSAIPVTDFMDILSAFDNLYVTHGDLNIDSISLADIEAIPVKGKRSLKKTSKLFAGNKPQTDNAPASYNSENEIKHNRIHKENLNLTGDVKLVYEQLSDTPKHIDTIAEELRIPVFRVLTALTQLEMKELAEAVQGRKFLIK